MKLRNPKINTQFLVYRKRLSLFHKASDHKKYWEGYWTPQHTASLITQAESGKLAEFELYGLKYLKKDDVILEAGCGPAHMVYGLVHEGFVNTMGVDYEEKVVSEANVNFPGLNIKTGDILGLELRDNSIDAYLSFGVVEHFPDGSEPALKEAQRVTKPYGVVMVSVPYLNPGRAKFLAKFAPKFNETKNNSLNFHQYYFSIQEFTEILSRQGLKVEEVFPYACSAFIFREHPLFSKIWGAWWMPTRAKRVIRTLSYNAPRWLRMRYGHMCMFVCRKIS